MISTKSKAGPLVAPLTTKTLNMKRNIFFFALLFASLVGSAQTKWMTRSAYIRFYSATPMENIEAINNQVSSVVDLTTGNMAFQVPIKAFQFEKALMQEHFNENYMESDKIPNASFKGKLVGFDKLNLDKDGTHELIAEGTLNIHGVEQPVKHPVKITIKGGVAQFESNFLVAPEDHNIAIPSAVAKNIAKTIEVTVKAQYDKK